jgi:hypothetical protein
LTRTFQYGGWLGLVAGDDRKKKARGEECRRKRARNARQQVCRAPSAHQTAATAANAESAALGALNENDAHKRRCDHKMDNEYYGCHCLVLEPLAGRSIDAEASALESEQLLAFSLNSGPVYPILRIMTRCKRARRTI